ncbi:hypothetical protein AZE42_00769 [Rhizopogon vesiculosus]|uniref:Uncharacterized protein n=1 Tax=Rhizopogon vesiculosus TaxID=180088 RepID=A0A1J8Q1A2_9AGAM|nr:hypothetical protein AZE42_00769 [Rhizopogon vesiculosus]
MPNLMSTVIDGHDVLATNDHDHILDHQHDSHTNDADIHDLNIPGAHFHNSIASSIPVSINGSHNVYYSSYPDASCNSFADISQYPYPLQHSHVPDGQLDLQYILSSDMSHSHSNFVHDHAQLQTKFHQSQDLSSMGPPSDPESQAQSSPSASSSASFATALHDLSRSPEIAPTPFTVPPSPPKVARYAHAMLPPIVHSSPSNARKTENDSRSVNKRLNSGSASQIDPYAAAFLREQLGEARWDTFYARLFERRLGPIKSKMRVKTKSAGGGELSNSNPGATAIDFLIKVEVVKEVLRTYVPHPYNPLKSLTHVYPGSPSGSVTLTRSTILVLSGWSNTQFSYWARRSEGISVLRDHDERLQAVAVALENRLRQGGVLQDIPDDIDALNSLTYGHVAESSPNVTGKGLDIIIEDVKKRTGLSPFLRGKHSSLDPFGSTISDKDTGPGPPSGPPSAPIYMPTFQAMEYSHSPPVSAEPSRRPKKKRRTSATESISSHVSSGAAHAELVANSGQSLGYAVEPRIKSDVNDVTSSALLSASYPLPRSLGGSVMDDSIATYQLPLQMDGAVENTNREYFPVSDSRSDLDEPRHKRPFSYPDLSMETQGRLSI